MLAAVSTHRSATTSDTSIHPVTSRLAFRPAPADVLRTMPSVRTAVSESVLAVSRADVRVGPPTWDRLMAGMPPLGVGAQGDAVRTGQHRLTELGYSELQGTASFGPKTLAALHAFQGESSLPAADSIEGNCDDAVRAVVRG